MKKNRERPISKLLFFSEEELQIIQKKMQEAGMTNFSAYCREQLVKGEVRHYDFQVLKEQAAYIGRIAGSINQIAKRCNENKSIHTNDVEQLRREFLALKADYLERVVMVRYKKVMSRDSKTSLLPIVIHREITIMQTAREFTGLLLAEP